MSTICPTVLAATVDDYQEQLGVIEPFANRIQIDLGDGDFTTATVGVADIWWPDTVSPDIHLMYQRPLEALQALVALKPNMIILHAESSGDLGDAIGYLRQHDIGVGVALLQQTNVNSVQDYIRRSDHVLIFSGSLGSFGGTADMSLLGKVPQIRSIREDIEIGWDGGANQDNVRTLRDGGIDVINVGGGIQRANHPENAYRALQRLAHD